MTKQKIEAERVQKAYNKFKGVLSDKESEIIVRYYGLDSNVRHSLREIGEIYQVTRERIRQIKVVALNKLKIYLKR